MRSRSRSTRTRNLRALDGFLKREQDVDWITWAKEAGLYISPLLMGAVLWQERERQRLLTENKALDDRVVDLAERVLTITAELKMYLFNERKT